MATTNDLGTRREKFIQIIRRTYNPESAHQESRTTGLRLFGQAIQNIGLGPLTLDQMPLSLIEELAGLCEEYFDFEAARDQKEEAAELEYAEFEGRLEYQRRNGQPLVAISRPMFARRDDSNATFASLTLNEWADEAHAMSRAKGWYDHEFNIGEKLMLIVTEVAEAMEAYRDANYPEESAVILLREDFRASIYKEKIKDTFPAELAGTLIRAFDLCKALGINILEFVEFEHRFNSTRERRHGGKLA